MTAEKPTTGASVAPGDRVRVWPGARSGRSYLATALTGVVVSDLGFFGGHPMVRVEKDSGGTDYIAPTHVEVIPAAEGDYMPGGEPS